MSLETTLQTPSEVDDQQWDQFMSDLDKEEAKVDAELAKQAGELPAAGADDLPPDESQPDKTGTQAAGADKGKQDKTQTPPGDKAGTLEAEKAAREKAEADAKAKADAEAKGKTEAGKEPTKYQKEVERRDKSWKALNAEKEAIAKSKAEVEEERKKLDREKTSLKQKSEFTPEQYENTAKWYEGEADRLEKAGKFEEAEKQRALSGLAKEEAAKLRADPKANASAHDAEFERQTQSSWTKAKTEMPELFDQTSPLHKEFVAFVQDKANAAFFEHVPNAPYLAAEFSRNKANASRVPILSKEVETLKQQLTDLQKATSITPGGAARMPSGEKSFEDLSEAEQQAELARMGHEADRIG
jgi:hypothetical protein